MTIWQLKLSAAGIDSMALSLRIPVVVAVIETLPLCDDLGWVTPLMEGLAVIQ